MEAEPTLEAVTIAQGKDNGHLAEKRKVDGLEKHNEVKSPGLGN